VINNDCNTKFGKNFSVTANLNVKAEITTINS